MFCFSPGPSPLLSINPTLPTTSRPHQLPRPMALLYCTPAPLMCPVSSSMVSRVLDSRVLSPSELRAPCPHNPSSLDRVPSPSHPCVTSTGTSSHVVGHQFISNVPAHTTMHCRDKYTPHGISPPIPDCASEFLNRVLAHHRLHAGDVPPCTMVDGPMANQLPSHAVDASVTSPPPPSAHDVSTERHSVSATTVSPYHWEPSTG